MFFAKKSKSDLLPAKDPILPLNDSRIEEIMADHEWAYARDNDGDIYGIWGGHVHFFVIGPQQKSLMIFAIMRQDIAVEHLEELRSHLEDWNRTHYWPRAMWNLNEETNLLEVRADVNVHYDFGASKEQLMQQFKTAFATISQLFDDVKERFKLPDVEEE